MSGSATAHSVLEPSPATKRVAGALVILYAIATMVPLAWIVLTSFKSPPDSISYPPKVLFEPTLEGYCNLFTTRSRQTAEYLASAAAAFGTCEEIARARSMVMVSDSKFIPRFWNSRRHRLRLDRSRGLPRHARGLRLLALQGAARRTTSSSSSSRRA